MIVYISGAITGVENYAQKFQEVEDILTKEGLEAVNPVKINHDHDKTWESYMKVDIIELMKCDAIFMLDGWEKSKGATIERNLAITLKMPLI